MLDGRKGDEIQFRFGSVEESIKLRKCEDEVGNRPKDLCYLFLGQKNGDLEACNKIEHEKNRHTCITFVAGKKRDKTICEKIEDLAERENCMGVVEHVLKNVPA